MTVAGVSSLAGRGLLYAQCWEDADIARAALRIRPGSTVLTIAAAGDNTLALLRDDPARVIAIDVNPAQTALVTLKMAAIRTLPDAGQVGRFLGAGATSDRLATYAVVRPALACATRDYWDAHQPDVAAGVIGTGRFERFLTAFRRNVLPLVPGRAVVRDMLRAESVDEQREIYRNRWDSRRWRLLFRVFFSRRALQRFGRDPAFFAHAHVDHVGEHFRARAEHALTDLPIGRNPYVTWILSGRFGAGPRMPDYLRADVQATVRQRLDRIALHEARLVDVLADLPARSVDAFYLSDVFELASREEHAGALAEIARVGRPGARICYWNNLVARRRPDDLAGLIESHDDEARRLHDLDRAFLYADFVVESVRGRRQ